MSGQESRSRNRLNESEEEVLERIENFRKRRPRFIDEFITLAHGAGGKASAALVDAIFIEAFGAPNDVELSDAAGLEVESGRIAFSTDSYVVNPIQFPGGSIGDLAINGTVNDLSVSGAIPRWISAAFVLEEGLTISTLREIVADMAAAAKKAGVRIVTGDTKVVPKGAADKLYITTAGVGTIPEGRQLGAQRVIPGDKIVISGSIGDHGMAVMMARGNLAIEADIHSDSAPVTQLVESLYSAGIDPHWMRDATRGGLGTVANELVQAVDVGVVFEDDALPVRPMVRGACDMLGIDPLYVANEGCFIAVVSAEQADKAVETLRTAGAEEATVIGEIISEPTGVVAVKNSFGGTRLVDMLVGDPLPRIC